jgi:hypothetical protein
MKISRRIRYRQALVERRACREGARKSMASRYDVLADHLRRQSGPRSGQRTFPRARATAFPVTTRSCPRPSIETENAAPSWTAGITSPVHTGGHHGVQIAARPPSVCLGAGAAHAAHWPRARAGPGPGSLAPSRCPAPHPDGPRRQRRYRTAAYVGCTRGESPCTGFPSSP